MIKFFTNRFLINCGHHYSYSQVQNPFIIELIDKTHLDNIVQLSEEKMIIMNCFVTWSSECKEFQKIMFPSIQKYQEIAHILNIDVDKHPSIVNDLQIKSIPFLALVYQNTFKSIFMKNGKFDDFLISVDQLSKEIKGDLIGEKLLHQLTEANIAKDSKQLIQLSNEGLQNNKLQRFHQQYILYQIQGYLIEGNIKDAKELMETLTIIDKNDLLYRRIKDHYDYLYELKEMNPDLRNLLIHLDNNPENLELRFQISQFAIKNNQFEIAIKQLLDLIKIDRNWDNRKSQKLLQEVFKELGPQNQLVVDGRKQLAELLY